MSSTPRRLWLCADDYGIAPGVSDAIRDLVARGRLNATSVMAAAPAFDRATARALDALNAGRPRVAIGLHVTLTAPFAPLTPAFRPLRDGAFLPLADLLLRALLRRLDARALHAEVAAQFDAFVAAFGRPPDFVDGHQHVHLFPQVRDAVLDAMAARAPRSWLRQCGSARPLMMRLGDRKGLLIDALSRPLRRAAAARGIATNPAFAGTYDFAATSVPAFGQLFATFVDGLPSGGLVMCHPGLVDGELRALDPLTDQREQEYAFFKSDEFPATLAQAGFVFEDEIGSAPRA